MRSDSERGLDRVMILAANIAPMDVISHIPLLCEEKSIPYIFVSSKVCCSFEYLTCRKH